MDYDDGYYDIVDAWVFGPNGTSWYLGDAADAARRARDHAHLDDPTLMRETFPERVRQWTWRRAAPSVRLP